MSNYHHVIERFTFITGSKGAFVFTVDGEVLFSKKAIGRHADPGEVLELFRQFIGPDVEPFPREL
ncbi:MAG: Rdx family protein [Candidatus Promineofilum sp.]|nr:Rdx family protein [Promineifilum sp.]MCW5863773.1 Rdx family protein [Anaerolineae bacterium]